MAEFRRISDLPPEEQEEWARWLRRKVAAYFGVPPEWLDDPAHLVISGREGRSGNAQEGTMEHETPSHVVPFYGAVKVSDARWKRVVAIAFYPRLGRMAYIDMNGRAVDSAEVLDVFAKRARA